MKGIRYFVQNPVCRFLREFNEADKLKPHLQIFGMNDFTEPQHRQGRPFLERRYTDNWVKVCGAD